jgi:hypothetical protein
MTAQQQLGALGISAEAFEGLVIVEMERSFMSFTTEEIRQFHSFLKLAYNDAREAARMAQEAGR